MDEKLLKEILEDLKRRQERSNTPVPVGISNRHAHLTKEDFKTLFGANADDTRPAVKQPGQHACNERVTVEGQGLLRDVRMIGRTGNTAGGGFAGRRAAGRGAPIRDSGKLIIPGHKADRAERFRHDKAGLILQTISIST